MSAFIINNYQEWTTLDAVITCEFWTRSMRWYHVSIANRNSTDNTTFRSMLKHVINISVFAIIESLLSPTTWPYFLFCHCYSIMDVKKNVLMNYMAVISPEIISIYHRWLQSYCRCMSWKYLHKSNLTREVMISEYTHRNNQLVNQSNDHMISIDIDNTLFK